MTPYRDYHLARFAQQRAQGRALIGAGAGTGLSALCAEQAGVDFLVIYNAGHFRMAGRGSMAGMMPFSNANEVVLAMAREILPVATRTPVLAGVCATDPFRDIPRFLVELKDMGFAGVQNFPSVALHDGNTRRELEETGYGFDKEVTMVRKAREMGLLTATYVRTVEETVAMVDAGADIIVPHVGLTAGGLIGAKSAVTLDDAVERIRVVYDAATALRPDVFVVCHGGPIVHPADAQYVMERLPGLAGFLGASSMERKPAEDALVATMSAFKAITTAPSALPVEPTTSEVS